MAERKPTLSAAEATALVERMRGVSSRWKPLMVVGLILIVSGFVVLAGIIELKREQAEAKVAEQAVQIADLNSTLDNTKVVIRQGLDTDPGDPGWHALARLIGMADQQVASLNQTLEQDGVAPATDTGVTDASADSASEGTSGAAPAATALQAPASSQRSQAVAGAGNEVEQELGTSAPPMAQTEAARQKIVAPELIRIFIHVQDQAQMKDAQAVASAWSGQMIGKASVVIPQVELVEGGADDTLRCTKKAACQLAGPVLDWINSQLAAPKLHLLDLSKRYENNPDIRSGTYEVWFAPGHIALKNGGCPQCQSR